MSSILTAKDIVSSASPDPFSIITYVSMLYKKLAIHGVAGTVYSLRACCDIGTPIEAENPFREEMMSFKNKNISADNIGEKHLVKVTSSTIENPHKAHNLVNFKKGGRIEHLQMSNFQISNALKREQSSTKSCVSCPRSYIKRNLNTDSVSILSKTNLFLQNLRNERKSKSLHKTDNTITINEIMNNKEIVEKNCRNEDIINELKPFCGNLDRRENKIHKKMSSSVNLNLLVASSDKLKNLNTILKFSFPFM